MNADLEFIDGPEDGEHKATRVTCADDAGDRGVVIRQQLSTEKYTEMVTLSEEQLEEILTELQEGDHDKYI